MGTVMTDSEVDSSKLLRLAKRGEQGAFAELFGCYRERLTRMINLRLDRRLTGRVDAADVVYCGVKRVAAKRGDEQKRPQCP